MSAIVITSLATSPKNTKCPLLATSQRWDCQSAKIEHIKVCVQNILRMLECKLDDVNACLTAYWWSSGWNVATLPSDATLAVRRRYESGCGTHALAASPRSSSLPGWCQHCWLARDWSDVVLTSLVHSSVKYSQLSTVTAADSCDGGISVLNHCLSWSKFVNTHLSHSMQSVLWHTLITRTFMHSQLIVLKLSHSRVLLV